MSYLRRLCQTWHHKDLLLCFLLRVLKFSLVFRPLIHLILMCDVGPSSFFCMWTLSIEKTNKQTLLSPTELSWHPCWKSIGRKCEHLYFWSLTSIPLIYLSILTPVAHSSSLLVILKSESMSHRTFFSRWFGPLRFLCNSIWILLSFCQFPQEKERERETARILIEVALSQRVTLGVLSS